MWKIVPKNIKGCVISTVFKSHLDEFLKSIPDRPPVSGYVVQNNNSNYKDWFNT